MLTVGLLCLHKIYLYPIIVFGGGSLAIVTVCLPSSSHMAPHSTWKPTSIVCRRQCYHRSSEGLLEDLTSGNRTRSHATQAGEPSVGCEKSSATTSLLRSVCQTHQIAISLIDMSVMWLSEKPTKFHATPKMNWGKKKNVAPDRILSMGQIELFDI